VRIIIECPENILHLEAGYIYADCLFDSQTLLQSGGGPYIIVNYGKTPSSKAPYCDGRTATFLILALNCDRLVLLLGALAHRVHYIA